MHRKSIAELQRQHDKQVEELRQEKERLMQEETAATLACKQSMTFELDLSIDLYLSIDRSFSQDCNEESP